MKQIPEHGPHPLFGTSDKGAFEVVDLPADAIRYRIKQREAAWARIFILYADGAEEYNLARYPDGQIRPYTLRNSNRRGMA